MDALPLREEIDFVESSSHSFAQNALIDVSDTLGAAAHNAPFHRLKGQFDSTSRVQQPSVLVLP
jgi:hypothetical protein